MAFARSSKEGAELRAEGVEFGFDIITWKAINKASYLSSK